MNALDHFKIGLGRRQYFITGFLLLALKYNLDRFVTTAYFRREWSMLDYLERPDLQWMQLMNPGDGQYYLTLLGMAIPFIAIGTWLTWRRLTDTGLPGWMVVLFFLPLVNLLFFLVLSVLPSKEKKDLSTENHKNSFFDKLIPHSNSGSAIASVGIVTLIAIAMVGFSVNVLNEYGFGVFVGIPFFSGLGSVLLYGYHRPRSLKQCLGVGFMSVFFFGVLLFVLAMEGILCIVMASPMGFIIGWIGAIIGYLIQHRELKSSSLVVSFVAIIPLISLIEHIMDLEAPLTEVKTEIVISASPETVWINLVAFNKMKEPEELLFKSGIAYPIKAEIVGKGVGAVRNCVFTTGTFVEPIEVWDEPRLLKFSVIDQPPPLVELSFYEDLHLLHLEGYFTSEKGQFLLTRLEGNKTRLEGTTWYRHRIFPDTYWKFWSDYILHQIHLRVLNHIKHKSEGDARP